jgi:hypothetical protein
MVSIDGGKQNKEKEMKEKSSLTLPDSCWNSLGCDITWG